MTIVVLLILAVVTIRAVQNDGIVEYATNATVDYQAGQDKEKDVLEYYESYLEETVGEWKQEGATITRINPDGTKTRVKIGDYVDYKEGSYTHKPEVAKGAGTSIKDGKCFKGYTLETKTLTTQDLKWRVLGLNKKGEIELISADPTTQELYLANDEGYVNAVTTYNEDGSVKELGTLDSYCNDLYGQGTNAEGKKVATGARSLNVDDINKLTKYAPGSGNIFKFRGGSAYIQCRIEKPDGTVVSDWRNGNYTTFRLPNEETTINKDNPYERKVEYTAYSYSIASNLTADDGFTADEATAISNIITNGTKSSYISQWLSSQAKSCDSSRAMFAIQSVDNGEVSYHRPLWRSEGFFGEEFCYMRPVVSLEANLFLNGSGVDVGSINNMWNIS